MVSFIFSLNRDTLTAAIFSPDIWKKIFPLAGSTGVNKVFWDKGQDRSDASSQGYARVESDPVFIKNVDVCFIMHL